MVTMPVNLCNSVVPNSVPALDGLLSSLSKNLDFVNDKVKLYMNLKERREKILQYLKEMRNKRNRMRRELVKNCRKLLSNHKSKEAEKASQEKKREHDMQELESFNREADELIEESKKLELPEDVTAKKVEVNTEKKVIGGEGKRHNYYLSSSDSESHSTGRRPPSEKNTEVVSLN
jgi:hypothetical protein